MTDSRLGPRRVAWLALPAGALAVSLLVPLAIFLGTTWLQGRTLHLVESASMEPAYPVGSVLIVEPVDPTDVRVGSTITFADPGQPGHRLISHRVVEVLRRSDGRHFMTKGDANVRPDPLPVSGSAVRGRVAWDVPKLGRALSLLRWPQGFLVLVALPGVMLAATEGWRWSRRRPGELPSDC